MKPLLQMFEFAFGCHHRQRTGVFTIKKRTYQVCLDCGQEFEYSWGLMHAIGLSVADSPDAPLHSMPLHSRPLNSTPLNSNRRAEGPVI